MTTFNPNFTSGSVYSPIWIVGEAWGQTEASERKPFVGEAGKLLTILLTNSGINREKDCFITNLIHERPPGNDFAYFLSRKDSTDPFIPFKGLQCKPELVHSIEALYAMINTFAPSIRVIVACGNYPLWALTGKASFDRKANPIIPTGVTKWRGSTVDYESIGPAPSIPVVPIYHPAALFRDMSNYAITEHDLKVRVKPLARGEPRRTRTRRYHIFPSFKETDDFLDFALSFKGKPNTFLTCDIETHAHLITCIGFAWSRSDAFCLPFITPSDDGETFTSYFTVEEEAHILRKLSTLFGGSATFYCKDPRKASTTALSAPPGVNFSNHNINFDLQYIYRYLLPSTLPKAYFDTMLAHHLLFPDLPKNLSYVSSLYCNYHSFWKDDGREAILTRNLSPLWTYNCEDNVVTFELTEVLRDTLEHKKMMDKFQERMDVAHLALKMMLRGVRIDLSMKGKMVGEVKREIERLEGSLRALLDPEIASLLKGKASKSEWYSSPKQLAVLLYDVLRLPPVFNHKTKKRTTDENAMLKLQKKYTILAPLFTRLQDLRTASIYYNNILSAKLDFDKRMRCSFNVAGTKTFRWSSDASVFGVGTNLENIPKVE